MVETIEMTTTIEDFQQRMPIITRKPVLEIQFEH
jgi:hypothetical protein